MIDRTTNGKCGNFLEGFSAINTLPETTSIMNKTGCSLPSRGGIKHVERTHVIDGILGCITRWTVVKQRIGKIFDHEGILIHTRYFDGLVLVAVPIADNRFFVRFHDKAGFDQNTSGTAAQFVAVGALGADTAVKMTDHT